MMSELRGTLLYEMTLDVEPPLDLGATPRGQRLVFRFKGGRFEGPRLRGEVLTTGGDWLLVRSDGVMELDVRRTLRTDDGAIVYAAYRGVLRGSDEAMARVGRGEAVAAEDLYFRTTPVFETGAPAYAWLNRIVAVGIGATTPTGVMLRVFEVL
jgi:hypothetical protein